MRRRSFGLPLVVASFFSVLVWAGPVRVSPVVTYAAQPDPVAAAPVVNAEDAKAAVVAALRAMMTRPLRMSLYLDTSPPQSPRSVARMDSAEFVPPDRLHTRTTNPSGVVTEMVQIGEQTYRRQGMARGKWRARS
jgi:hypothetical protein